MSCLGGWNSSSRKWKAISTSLWRTTILSVAWRREIGRDGDSLPESWRELLRPEPRQQWNGDVEWGLVTDFLDSGGWGEMGPGFWMTRMGRGYQENRNEKFQSNINNKILERKNDPQFEINHSTGGILNWSSCWNIQGERSNQQLEMEVRDTEQVWTHHHRGHCQMRSPQGSL